MNGLYKQNVIGFYDQCVTGYNYLISENGSAQLGFLTGFSYVFRLHPSRLNNPFLTIGNGLAVGLPTTAITMIIYYNISRECRFVIPLVLISSIFYWQIEALTGKRKLGKLFPYCLSDFWYKYCQKLLHW